MTTYIIKMYKNQNPKYTICMTFKEESETFTEIEK